MSQKTVREIYELHKDKTPKKKKVEIKSDWELYLEQKNKKPSKMRNKWVVIDGIKFQSTGEGYYYLELKDRLLRGQIKGFKRQVWFKLEVNGIEITNYVADFVVENFGGTFEIIDHKSVFTAKLDVFRMKKALMMACYGILIKEVGKK
jgi:hypothetical protein